MHRNQHIHLKTYAILGFIFVAALGTLLHFAFDWSEQNRIVAFISPVNESMWEHLKLLVYPLLLFSVLEYIKIGPSFDNYIIAKAFGLLGGMLTMVMLFYTYSGIIGNHYLIVDIIIFLIGIIVSFMISSYILNHRIFCLNIFQPIGLILILLIVICFMWFTFFPPSINLFKDSSTGRYGYDMNYK